MLFRSPNAGVALRLKAPDAAMAFVDGFHGARSVHLPTDCGDIVVRRKDGGFAYMFAVVVDDAAQGVTEVVRGDDLLDATAQQLAVYDAIGQAPPERWLHLPSELSLQHFAIRHDWFGRLLNLYYATMHIVSGIAFLIWLFWRQDRKSTRLNSSHT